MNIKAIIFDYDGVIAESVRVKAEAFAELYKEYGDEVIEKVVEHHLLNGGISRFEKFKLYHMEFFGRSISEEEISEFAENFSTLVLQKVINAPYVDGALEFLENHKSEFDFFISTGTPEDEIKYILEQKKIINLFKEVFGSPSKKNEHVKRILKKYSYKNNEIIFVGDAISDYEAAKNNDIKFVSRYTTDARILKNDLQITDFTDLLKIIQNL